MGAYTDLSESDIQRRMLELALEGTVNDRKRLAMELDVLTSLAAEKAESGRDSLGRCPMDYVRLRTELAKRGAELATEGAQLRTELTLRKPSDSE